MEVNTVQTQLKVSEFTPEFIGGRMFSIPVYQRLYAWEDKQINDLLMDLKNSPENRPYYLGSITTDFNESSQRFDLIDGQQRITTLFLLATVLVKYDKRWSDFIKVNHSLRLFFPSRDKDMQYIQGSADGKIYDDESINRRLPAAIKLIDGFIENTLTSDNERKKFATHVYENLKLVHVELPKGTDMNWYFEIMNSRGEQLEKHEILKARILDKIPEDLRFAYSRIWNACSQMDVFIEDLVENDISSAILAYNGTEESLSKIILLFERNSFEGEEPHTLCEILKANKEYKFEDSKVSEAKVSSIVNFPEFLLLTFAVYKKQIPKNYSETKLLDIFNIREDFDCARFVQHILKMRILFDNYVLKSQVIENQTKWEISCSEKDTDNSSEYVRAKLEGMLVHLQSMLYVSNTQQENWLVPFMSFLNQHQSALFFKTSSEKAEFLLNWLEQYDNEMAKARLSNKQLRPIAEGSLSQNGSKSLLSAIDFENILDKGLRTERYWFFKLDYLLLKQWNENGLPEKHHSNKKFIDRFQFRQSRSVEHVSPQNPMEPNIVWNESELHSFGNLALISNSTNSSYNHWQPSTKREQFKLHNEKWGLESLKLLEIYSYEEWTIENANRHRHEMVEILKKSIA